MKKVLKTQADAAISAVEKEDDLEEGFLVPDKNILVVERLRDQLEEKDQIIQEKDRIIKELHDQLAKSQINLQNQMIKEGLLQRELTFDDVENILNNPFVKFNMNISSDFLTTNEHEEIKKLFVFE